MLPLWLHLLALTLPAPALAQEPVAVVPLGAVLRAPRDEPEAPPVTVMVDSVQLRITPGEESLVELDITLRALEPGWVDLAVTGGALAVDSARLDGREVALSSREGGARWLTAELRGEHRLRVRGSVATPGSSLDLPLPLASRARVVMAEPGWDLVVEGGIPVADGSVLLASSPRLVARWQPHAAPAPKPRVVTVTSATGVSFDESGLEGRATLRYRVAHGSVEQVSFDIAGAPDSVEVTGPAVRDTQLRGQRVTVRLARPMEGSFELQVTFRVPPPGDAEAHPAPVIKPDGVFEHSGWLTVARADTAMLVPEPRSGLEAVPGSSLPEWATGLVPGTPVVSYSLSGRSQSLDYRLLSFDPVSAPPTVVDEARFQLAATAHGRVLMKARYTVRNDRNQYLRLLPPPGFEVLGVRVAGQVRQPVADGGAVYIPLEKSVESLQGLISFPVEVYLLGDEAAWDKKGQRSLRTPAVDAPVAYARWEVWLPTDVEWQELSGLPKHVADWTSSEHSLEYGRAVRSEETDDSGAWEEDEEDGRRVIKTVQARSSLRGERGRDKDGVAAPVSSSSSSSTKNDADEDASLELFNQAYQAYNANDFDTAQQYLERSLQLDSGNASAQALLGNVQVVTGQSGGEGKAEEAQARRVRELARARAVDTELEQKEVRRKAEEALRAGDLEVAERELERLEVMTRDLSRLEQSESVEQQLLLEETAKQLEDTRGQLAKKQKSAAPKVSASPEAVELEEIPDRFVSIVIDEPMPSFDGTPWPDAGVAQGQVVFGLEDEEGPPQDAWSDERVAQAEPEPEPEPEEVYWQDDDYDDYDRGYAETLSIDYASRPGSTVRRAGAAVGDALRGAGRALRRPEPAASVEADHRNYRQHVELDFDSVEIEGELVRPDGQLLQDRQRDAFEPLIQLRDDFDGELAASTGDVGGGGLTGLDDASAGWAGAGPSEPIVMDFGMQAAGAPGPAAMEVAPQLVSLDGATSGSTVAMVLESDTGPMQGLVGGIGGLIGAKGEQSGAGGLGSRGSGLGGGGTAEGLGGLGTSGGGGGAYGYGAGSGRSYAAAEDAPPPPPQPTPEPPAKPAEAVPVVAFGPAPAAPEPGYAVDGTNITATGRKDPAMARARGNVAHAPALPALAPSGTTSLPAPSQTVSAAHLTINIPKAGERLAFEQLLVAENEPLTIDIRYRTRSRR